MRTLALQAWPPGSHILIVDNDQAGSAAAVVQAAQAHCSVPIEWRLAPEGGFSTVRNAALDLAPVEAAVCFVDDDAAVPQTWVKTMVET